MNWMWIKKNRTLLITLASLVALICIGTPLWLYKQEQRQLATSGAYSKALISLKKDDPESEKAARETLEKIDTPMAQLYAAHLSLKLGEADKAAKAYEAFLAKAGPKDSLRPLALFGLKKSYEALKQPEKTKSLDADLQKLGFEEKK